MSKTIKLKNDTYWATTSYGVILYDSEAGNNGTITLNDSITNYKYLDIYFRGFNNSNRGGHTQVLTLNSGFIISLNYVNASKAYVYTSKYGMSEKTITPDTSLCNEYCITSASFTSTGESKTYIQKVIGYR